MSRYPTPAPVILPQLFPLFDAARAACRQDRTADRLVTLSLGAVWALGRHTLSQHLVALGAGAQDWTAWSRLLAVPGRVDVDGLQRHLVTELRAELGPRDPFPVVLDATHLPRSSPRMPGVGPAGRHRRGHRWVGLNALLPRSAQGDSRALPLRWTLAPPPSAVPLAGVPPQTEWAAGIAQLAWLREVLDAQGDVARPVLAVADGGYSSAPFWTAVPARTTVLSRCARNRALYALPPPRAPHTRGRPRTYGARLPTPHELAQDHRGWRAVPVRVRGRRHIRQVKVVGPVLVRPAGAVPLYLLIVQGLPTSASPRQRQPTYLLVNACQDRPGRWVLPVPLATLLGWAWQRWEVEVLHRELKSGFGLGQQQAWSAAAIPATTAWVCWVYAVLVLAGYRAWGYVPPPGAAPGRWHRPRRWALGTLWQQVRTELWRLGEFQPTWTRSPDTWAEMRAWLAAQPPAMAGYRRI